MEKCVWMAHKTAEKCGKQKLPLWYDLQRQFSFV